MRELLNISIRTYEKGKIWMIFIKMYNNVIMWAFPEKNCTPVEDINLFLWISGQFYHDPLEFSTFLHQPLWKSSFFPQILTNPTGIPTPFTLPPGNFH